MSDVTQILQSAQAGDPQAAEKLLPLVYDELRKLAAARLAQEQPGQTLQATALVHEAYLRLVGGPGGNMGGAVGNALSGVPGDRGLETGDSHESPNLSPVPCSLSPPAYDSRGHFFGAAAEAMRRILVERARQKLGPNRGGGQTRIELDAIGDLVDSKAELVLAIHEALDDSATCPTRA